ITRALILSISSGFSCFSFCLPFTLPVFLGANRPGVKESAKNLFLFLSGRLSAYLIFGLVFGILGKAFATVPLFRSTIIPILYFLLALLLILYALVNLNPFANFVPCRIFKQPTNAMVFPFLFGLIVGFNPCPPFLLAITNILDLGGALNGILFFFFFFLGNTIFFLPLLFTGIFTRYAEIRIAARVVALIAGIYFILLALRNLAL
ncbi:MAG: sulfite exporter TauE/SafE family protein, partial [candidate division WOR-3 bacterium]